jgi:hypothetical protein
MQATPPFLTSAVGQGKWSASGPCRFAAAETSPRTSVIGGYVGTTAHHRIERKRKLIYPFRE